MVSSITYTAMPELPLVEPGADEAGVGACAPS